MKVGRIWVALLMTLSTCAFVTPREETSTVSVWVYDIGADRSVAHAKVGFVVYSDCTSTVEILRSSVTTGENGEFQTSLPAGQHALSVTAPSAAAVQACIKISSGQEMVSCSGAKQPMSGRILQGLIVRIVTGNRSLPPDILTAFHPCVPIQRTVCEPLNLPRAVSSKDIVLIDEQGHPFANATLEFRRYSKGRGELFGSVTTDREGRADLSTIYDQPHAAGSLDQVAFNGSASFLLELSRKPSDLPQRIKILKWRCQGQEHLQATPE